VRNLRWWIAGLLALATALNYLDRQSLPVVVGELQKEIPISEVEYSQMQSLFLLSYAIMYAVGGGVMDWLGTRAGYALMIVFWSVATLLHGFASSVGELKLFRFLLGLGEGGAFPGSAKAVSEWFPASERSFAFGIFNTGSSVGAVIAPPLIALIVSTSGWRWVFYVAGALGVVWGALWLLFYELPSRHKRITAEERDYLREQLEEVGGPTPKVSYFRLFSYRQVWGLLIAKFLTDSAWFFFIFWLPKYLADVRHLNIKEIGYYAWIPYALAGVGSFFGGWLSSYLIRRNFTIDTSRKVALCASALLMPVSLGIITSPLSIAIAFFSTAMFAHQFWSTIIQTLVADMFPSSTVGAVAGLLGCAGSFGAMLFNLLVGQIVTHFHSYGPVFTIAGLMHPIGFLTILLLVRRIERVA
jgi:ACS family hexuronate transporter-like MFS transporter